ncbi:MAG: hypothetical protein H0W69_05880 [Gemmatimonadaceae bacterium]|nr:hypothetical protein [Gemmatimonadaceae bacterium]
MVWLLVIAGIVYLGGSYANAYLDYFRYKDAVKQEAKYAQQHTDLEIQARLKVFADSLGLPKTASMVRVNRGTGRVTISGSYLQSIPVPLLGARKVRFNPQAEHTF